MECQDALMKRQRLLIAVTSIGLSTLALAACSSVPTSTGTASQAASGPASVATASEKAIAIAPSNFSESELLSQIYGQALSAAGWEVTYLEPKNREESHPALLAGEADMAIEYLGSLTNYLNVVANGADAPALATSDVASTLTEAQKFAAPEGLTILTPSAAVDANGYAVTATFAQTNNIRTLSDLGAYSQTTPIRLGGPVECPTRPLCQAGLEKVYGLKVGEFTPLDYSGPATKAALADGTIDVGVIFTSDGEAAGGDIVVLADDKQLQPAENVTPIVRTDTATPELTKIADEVSASLTTQELAQMNMTLADGSMTPAQVATQYLAGKDLT